MLPPLFWRRSWVLLARRSMRGVRISLTGMGDEVWERKAAPAAALARFALLVAERIKAWEAPASAAALEGGGTGLPRPRGYPKLRQRDVSMLFRSSRVEGADHRGQGRELAQKLHRRAYRVRRRAPPSAAEEGGSHGIRVMQRLRM